MSTPDDERRVDRDIHLIPWSGKPSRWAYARSLARGGSSFVGVRASKLAPRLAELTERRELLHAYDVVWSHFLLTAPAAVAIPATARVLDADFSLGASARRAVDRPGARWRQRIYLRLDAAAITHRERRLSTRFDHIVVASELERERIGRVRVPVTVVPNAIPDPGPSAIAGRQRDGLLFVGSLDYGVNANAVASLVRDILPRVRSRLPGATLTIVGRNPGAEVLSLASAPGVSVIADAPSLDQFYDQARAVVAPLRGGGGTRIKLLEAMARSLAIVATPAAVEGLRLRHGASALVASDPDGLAEHCVALLRDPELAERLGRCAREVWSADHQPSRAREAILGVLDGLTVVG
jgi:glycosyltransferase involved in cell wall biosynthesis